MKYFDLHTALYFIYMIVFCLVSMVISGAVSTDVLMFAGIPVMFFAAFLSFYTALSENLTEGLLKSRLQRRKFTDAILFYRSAVLLSLILGAGAGILYCLNARFFSSVILHVPLSSLTLTCLLPYLVLGTAIGAMKGFLNAAGMRRLSDYSFCILSAATMVLGVFFGFFMQIRGEKVGLLLQNEEYAAVYSAAGIGIGMSLAVLITFIYLAVVCRILIRSLHSQEDSLRIDHDERMSGIMPFYLRRTFPGWLFSYLPGIILITDYRIGTMQSENTTYGPISSVHWGSFMGVTLPALIFAGCITLCIFSKGPAAMAGDLIRKKSRSLRNRFSILQRMTGFISIASAWFLMSSARPIVQVFHAGMIPAAREGAAASMQFLAPSVPLLVTCLLLMLYASKAQRIGFSMLCCGISFVIQTLSMLVFSRIVPRTIEAVSISLDLFFLAYILLFLLGGRKSITKSLDLTWLFDWLMLCVSGLIASIPVFLLSDVITNEVIPFGGMILMQIVFTALYLIMSIVLHAADLQNMHLIPFGRSVLRLAGMLGGRGR